MGYFLQAGADSFLKGIDLVYIIGILSTVIGSLWAFYRFRYEKNLDRFTQANSDLFADDKQKKLAAIATLSVFKGDRMFGKSTTNVLLSKLYTETDYDITYAIGSALIQFSGQKSLLKIASEIAGINRNFFSQTSPYQAREDAVANLFDRISKIKNNSFSDIQDLKEIEKENDLLEKRSSLYKDEYLRLNDKLWYEIDAQEKITADAYARIIREAAAKKFFPLVSFFRYIKQVFWEWNFSFLEGKFPLYLYQNVFVNIQLVKINTSRCSIMRSDFERSTIADVYFNHPLIYDSTFAGSYFSDCVFHRGVVSSGLMINIEFKRTLFRKTHFKEIYFAGCTLKNCSFEDCKGLTASHFCGANIDKETAQSLQTSGITSSAIQELKPLSVIQEVLDSELYGSDQEKIILAIAAKISRLDDVVEIFDSGIDKVLKESIVKKSSVNFTLKDIFPLVTQSEKNNKWYLLYLMNYDKTLENLMVEIYDTKEMTDEDIDHFLKLLWPEKTPEDFQAAATNSILSQKEKNIFLPRLQKIFGSAVVEDIKKD